VLFAIFQFREQRVAMTLGKEWLGTTAARVGGRDAGATLGGLNAPAKTDQLGAYYGALYRAWGPQHWWPGKTRFEVIAGAYLVQNTAWANVERALRRLRAAPALSLDGMRRIPLRRLEYLIRPVGYFRQKARYLKAFVTFLDERYGGSFDRMFRQSTEELREELLALRGVGPETADSILLYAGQRAVFVVDAYARRILDRHGLASAKAPYDEVRALLERALDGEAGRPLPVRTGRGTLAAHPPSPMSRAKRSPRVQVYNEMHGLIVGVGKQYCLKSKALCEGCPLQPFLPRPKSRRRSI
jgi:endonuclease III related protein